LEPTLALPPPLTANKGAVVVVVVEDVVVGATALGFVVDVGFFLVVVGVPPAGF
jgi:hypothetical protein